MTAVAFLFCAFSVMGIPPFGGFFSKYMVFAGAFAAGQTAIGLVFLVGAFLTIIYLFRLFTAVFLGEPGRRSWPREGSPLMVACVVVLAALSLAERPPRAAARAACPAAIAARCSGVRDESAPSSSCPSSSPPLGGPGAASCPHAERAVLPGLDRGGWPRRGADRWPSFSSRATERSPAVAGLRAGHLADALPIERFHPVWPRPASASSSRSIRLPS